MKTNGRGTKGSGECLMPEELPMRGLETEDTLSSGIFFYVTGHLSQSTSPEVK